MRSAGKTDPNGASRDVKASLGPGEARRYDTGIEQHDAIGACQQRSDAYLFLKHVFETGEPPEGSHCR